MPIIAKLRHLRIAPRKVRLVADLIRGKSVEEAKNILSFTVNKSSPVLLKLLKSAIANAKNQIQLEEPNLYISKITVDEGPKLKRWMPRARGQAYEIQKKTSHVTLVLDLIKPTKIKKIKRIKKKTMETKESAKIKKQRVRPEEKEIARPKFGRGIKRIFRRKSF